MVPVLARQSIILKCDRKRNTILGNYECAYALGLMSKLSGVSLLEDHSDMRLLKDTFMEQVSSYQPADDKEEHLLHILELYEAPSDTDEQTEELLEMGLREERPWVI
ncbi:MAG: DUF3837 domain-containing protein [Lachnospiraceae bacterium]|nr:DUF3837 domain-containing protein [Lachnospiraceae bacterium]